jgi:hypothetical protein
VHCFVLDCHVPSGRGVLDCHVPSVTTVTSLAAGTVRSAGPYPSQCEVSVESVPDVKTVDVKTVDVKTVDVKTVDVKTVGFRSNIPSPAV